MSRHSPINASSRSSSRSQYTPQSGDGFSVPMRRMDNSMLIHGSRRELSSPYDGSETPVLHTGHVTEQPLRRGQSLSKGNARDSIGQTFSVKATHSQHDSHLFESLKDSMNKLIAYQQETRNMLDEQDEFIAKYLARRHKTKAHQAILENNLLAAGLHLALTNIEPSHSVEECSIPQIDYSVPEGKEQMILIKDPEFSELS